MGPPPDVVTFLPNRNESEAQKISLELLRIDMERRWILGSPEGLESYLKRFAWVFDTSPAKGSLAFEEYRLRLAHGDMVRPDDYARRWKVDTTGWPRPSQSECDTATLQRTNASTVDILRLDSQRLVETVEEFPKAGQCFGDFHLIRELGRGKFSRVFLAHQGALANRPVVLKISSDQWTESEKLAKLQHAYVVPVYSMSIHERLAGICMPYLGEVTLNDVLQAPSPCQESWNIGWALRSLFCPQLSNSNPRTSPSGVHNPSWLHAMGPAGGLLEHEWRCASLARKIAEGLAHAHRRGIIHRDLKPANILITDDGDPMILDFNLSEDLVVGGRSTLMVGGTLPYMAPEHLEAILSGTRIDDRCDIYSFGVLLYEMLSRQQPFPIRSGQFSESVLRMIQDRKQMLSLEPLRKYATTDMVSVVRKCLSPRLEDRYVSMSAVVDDMRMHLESRPLLHAANRSWTQRASKWFQRNRHRATLSTVCVIAMLSLSIAGLMAWWQTNRANQLAAREQFGEAASTMDDIRTTLAVPSLVDPPTHKEVVAQGLKQGLLLCHKYGLTDGAGWKLRKSIALLAPAQQIELQTRLQETLYLMVAEGQGHSLPETEEVEKIAIASFGLPSIRGSGDLLQHLHERLVSGNEKSELARRLSALKELREGKYAAAVEILEPLSGEFPESSIVWLLLGNAHAGLRDYSSAEIAFAHSIARSPRTALPYIYRGLCRMELQLFGSAQQDFTQALRLQPDLTAVYINRALARAALGQTEQALQDVSKAIDLGRRDSQTFLLRSDLETELGFTNEAEADLKRGLEAKPTSPDGWLSRAEHWLDQGSADLALADYVELARQVPGSVEAWQNIANVQSEHLQNYPKAIEALDELLQIDPANSLALAARGVNRARLGQAEQARNDIQGAVKVDRSATTCYVAGSGLAVLAKGDVASSDAGSAIELLRECLRQDPAWRKTLLRDPDWESLRNRSPIQEILKALEILDGPPE